MSIKYCTQCGEQSTWTEFEGGICDGCWYMNQKPTTQAEARDLAIDWQNWQSEQSLSYGEILKFQNYFQALAAQFDLTDEFKENGII